MWHERFVVASLVVRWLADHRSRAETVECSSAARVVADKGAESEFVALSEIVTTRRLQHSSLNVIDTDGALELRMSFETPRGPLLFSKRQPEAEHGGRSVSSALASAASATDQLPQNQRTVSTAPHPGAQGAVDGAFRDMTATIGAGSSSTGATEGDSKSSATLSSATGTRDSASSGSSGDDTEGGGTNAATIKSQPAWEAVTSTSTKLILFERSWASTLKFARRLRKMGNAYVCVVCSYCAGSGRAGVQVWSGFIAD